MSITSVTECYEGRSHSINEMWQRSYTRVFEVITSDAMVGPVAIRLDGSLPWVGMYYQNVPSGEFVEHDYGSFVQNISYECEGGTAGGIVWKVTVQYGPWSPSVFGPNPVEWPLKCTFGGERTEKVHDFDRDGVPIRNSAGDRFGDPVTTDDHIKTIILTRNELVSTYDPTLASLLSDSINDDEWNGIAKGWCKMGVISTGEEQYDSNSYVWYYTVTYPIQINTKPWRKDLLDQGYNQIYSEAFEWDKTESLKGKDGQPINDPALLDGTGKRLTGTGDPVILPYEVFREADWSLLNIDMSTRLGV